MYQLPTRPIRSWPQSKTKLKTTTDIHARIPRRNPRPKKKARDSTDVRSDVDLWK
jgi:hypothetical protein